MAIKIIAVGRKHEPWIVDGVERYQKRLKKPFDVEWVLLPPSPTIGIEARQDESRRISSKLPDDGYTVLLDERGELIDSVAASHSLLRPMESGKKLTLIIGGAYGVNEAVRNRADMVWSLSPLVFPHQLVRVLVVEQIYRAQEIAAGRPYHHV